MSTLQVPTTKGNQVALPKSDLPERHHISLLVHRAVGALTKNNIKDEASSLIDGLTQDRFSRNLTIPLNTHSQGKPLSVSIRFTGTAATHIALNCGSEEVPLSHDKKELLRCAMRPVIRKLGEENRDMKDARNNLIASIRKGTLSEKTQPVRVFPLANGGKEYHMTLPAKAPNPQDLKALIVIVTDSSGTPTNVAVAIDNSRRTIVGSTQSSGPDFAANRVEQDGQDSLKVALKRLFPNH